MLRRFTWMLMLACFLCPSRTHAETSSEYELTVAVVKKALKGWELYESKDFAASFQDGYYTDPDPKTRSREFWANDRYARLDRDGNGHHETIFEISDGELVYVGSIGPRGRFVDVARKYQAYAGKPLATYVSAANRL